jgi:hypothetical protein
LDVGGEDNEKKKYLLERRRKVMLLFPSKASAIAVAPVTPILLSFECWWRSIRKRKILTGKGEISDAFVFFQSISDCSCSCISNVVHF